MNILLEKTLAAMPLYPNIEYELSRAGLTHTAAAAAIGEDAASFEDQIIGRTPIYADVVVGLLRVLGVGGFEYLAYCPKTDGPTEAEIEAAELMLGQLSQIMDDDMGFALVGARSRFTPREVTRAMALVRTLINAGNMGLLPRVEDARQETDDAPTPPPDVCGIEPHQD